MTTEHIIRRFLDGTNLYSYSTLIAFKEDGAVYVSREHYTNTTARHIHELCSALQWPDIDREMIEREVSIRVVDSQAFPHADDRPAPWMFGRSPRKGSVGYRRIDEMPERMTAPFSRMAPRAH